MSKQNRRSGGSFRTLGQRMLSFGRGIMRTYSNETSLQPDTSASESSRPRGQWRSMTTDNLVWRQEQSARRATPPPAQIPDADFGDDYESDYANYDNMSQPIQRQPQPRPRPQQPQNSTPSYIQTKDGAMVRASQQQFSDPIQRRLNAIAAAHEAKNAEREQERDQKIENIQRKVETGEMTTRRRRGSIDVDYVQTESLLPPEERGKEPVTPVQPKREDTTDAGNDAVDSAVGSDVPEEANWFDEIPDDDADIDNIAGFESTDDAVQRMPDDLPQFDMSSLNEEENPDDMGEFEGGYDDVSSQSAEANDIINRDYDEAVDYSDDVNDSSPGASNITDMPVQRMAQDFELPMFDDVDNDETVPLIPNMDMPDVASPTLPTNTPVQRTESDTDDGDDSFTDFSHLDASPSSDTPAQRESIERTGLDETPSFADFSDDSEAGDASYTDFSDVDSSPRPEPPVQRESIERTELDDTLSFTDYSDDSEVGDASYTDFSDVEWSPRQDSPVQRESIERTELDETPSFADFSDDSEVGDASYTDFSDVDMPSHQDSPVQRESIERTELDETPSFADFSDDSEVGDASYTDFSDVEPSLHQGSPVQRESIERTGLDETASYTDFNDEDDAPYTDFSDVEPSQQDTSVQRDVSDDPDYADFNDVTAVDSTPTPDMSVQRQEWDANEPLITPDDFGDMGSLESPSSSSSIDNSSPAQRRIQRQAVTPPDLGDGGDYTDYGDATWAEMNDYAPATGDTTSDTPIHRDFDETDYDDVSNMDGQVGDAPAQRDYIHRDYGETDYEDVSDIGGQSMGDAPVQRNPIQPDNYDEADYGEIPDMGSQMGDVPVQRNPIQPDNYDEADYGEIPDMGGQSMGDAPVQHDYIQPDNETNYSELDFSSGEPLSIQPPAVQRSEMDDRTFDMINNVDSLHDEPQDDYGGATWAELNNYSPATDQASSGNPIQRDLDDTAPYEPYVEDNFDHRENTDGMTAMNILDDYLSEQSGSDTGNASSGHDSPPVQRRYADESYDYLPEDFDPTPTIYDFNQQVDGGDMTSGQDTPVQRSAQDDFVESDRPDEQPVDLFQALSQAGMVDTPPSGQPSSSQSPIQRDYQEEHEDDYTDYGDATWAEVHNYSPATDNTPSGDSAIQRTPDDDFDGEEPMDLFQAMSQAGMIDVPSSGQPSSSQPSIQRDYQDDDAGNDDRGEMMDLYNAMMQAGMIQDSSQSESPSSHGDPIQRSSQPESEPTVDSMMEALMRASQVSESTSTTDNQSSHAPQKDAPVNSVMSQPVIQRAETIDPVALSDNVTSPSTNRQDIDDGTEKEDKEYLSQLARDVFRVIKRRLREEKERRG